MLGSYGSIAVGIPRHGIFVRSGCGAARKKSFRAMNLWIRLRKCLFMGLEYSAKGYMHGFFNSESIMSYWDRTDTYLRKRGGRAPLCPNCGKAMFPADDHGRFVCLCGGGSFDAVGKTSLPSLTEAQAPDEERKK